MAAVDTGRWYMGTMPNLSNCNRHWLKQAPATGDRRAHHCAEWTSTGQTSHRRQASVLAQVFETGRTKSALSRSTMLSARVRGCSSCDGPHTRYWCVLKAQITMYDTVTARSFGGRADGASLLTRVSFSNHDSAAVFMSL